MGVLCLPRGGSCILEQPAGATFARLRVSRGNLRLSLSTNRPATEITVAITGVGQPQLLRFHASRPYLLEAMTEAEFELSQCNEARCEEELTTAWLLHFSLIRHHLGSEERINQLLNLLGSQFGSFIPDGVALPFSLPHARIAEMIGCTRSTVTRHLGRLKQQGLILDQESELGLILHASFASMR